MLTERQVYIVGLCINPSIVRTIGEISKILKVSERTVLQEIKEINEELGDKLVCKKGNVYVSKTFSKDFLKQLQTNCVGYTKYDKYKRDRVIMTYLAFRGDYVSLEEISEHIFLSKTGLYKYIKSDWRLQESLEFDPVKGTRLKGINEWKEEEIRRFISRNINWNYEKLEFLNLDFEPLKMISYIEKIYDEYMIISGRTVADIVKTDMVNYIAVTIIRKKTEHELEEESYTGEFTRSNFLEDISKKIEEEFNVRFSDQEKILMEEVLRSAEQINYSFGKNNPDIKKIQKIVEKYLIDIKRKMHIKFDENEDMNFKFSLHLFHLKKRMEQNVYTPNPDKREISGRFPWASALVRDYLLPKLDFKVQEIEISALILYTEIYLRSGREQLHAFFITRDVPGRIVYTLEMLKTVLSKELSSIELVPFYKFDLLKEEYLKRKAIFITTEADVAILSKQMVLIRPLMEKDEEERAVKLIKLMIKESEAEKINIDVKELNLDGEEFLEKEDKDRYIVSNYDYLIDYNFISDEESSLDRINFDKQIEYRNHMVKGIIRANLCPEKTNPYLFTDKLIDILLNVNAV
ncbi:BglG family transcription antiterminator [Lachnospira pectinoschiza]|uniref:Transcriptional antiterminator n=1 Tax=Lachnospira pectinoschiza TaxID=28052 RepID=A0A1G9ZHR9_9FIRM|nr:PRD domain-containing protein [Lachnospira pectinoschiza]SDN21002.1 Transcriptional antiterminator [Lachnospira pectinoschiza]